MNQQDPQNEAWWNVEPLSAKSDEGWILIPSWQPPKDIGSERAAVEHAYIYYPQAHRGRLYFPLVRNNRTVDWFDEDDIVEQKSPIWHLEAQIHAWTIDDRSGDLLVIPQPSPMNNILSLMVIPAPGNKSTGQQRWLAQYLPAFDRLFCHNGQAIVTSRHRGVPFLVTAVDIDTAEPQTPGNTDYGGGGFRIDPIATRLDWSDRVLDSDEKSCLVFEGQYSFSLQKQSYTLKKFDFETKRSQIVSQQAADGVKWPYPVADGSGNVFCVSRCRSKQQKMLHRIDGQTGEHVQMPLILDMFEDRTIFPCVDSVRQRLFLVDFKTVGPLQMRMRFRQMNGRLFASKQHIDQQAKLWAGQFSDWAQFPPSLWNLIAVYVFS